MRTIGKRLMQVTIAVGALALAIAAAAPSLAKGNSALKIRAVKVDGNRVVITITNSSVTTRTGSVTCRVPMPDGSIAIVTPITVTAGGTVTVEVPPPSSVIDGQPVGVVVDDGVPF